MVKVVKCLAQGHMGRMGQRVGFEPRTRLAPGHTFLTIVLSWWLRVSLFGPHLLHPPHLLTFPLPHSSFPFSAGLLSLFAGEPGGCG